MWNARQPALVTLSLMVVNLAVFAWIVLGEPRALSARGIVSERQWRIGLSDRFLRADILPQYQDEWYRLLTSGFLHFGLIHIGFNMFLLYQLGHLIEPAVGRVRFGLMYLAALLGGSAGALIMQPDSFHGGASGAVFGLMAAAAIGLRQRGINPFSTSIGPLLLINLLITFTIPGISIGGHLGGIVAGGACAFAVLAPQWRHAVWLTYAIPAAVAVGAVLVSIAVVEL